MKKSKQTREDPIAPHRERLDKLMVEQTIELLSKTSLNTSATPEIKRVADLRKYSSVDIAKLHSYYFSSKDQEAFDKMADELSGEDPKEKQKLMGHVWKEQGAAMFKEGRYPEAREAWEASIRSTLLLADTYHLPSPTSRVVPIEKAKLGQFVDVVACSNNIAQAYTKEGNLIQALEWLDEVQCLYNTYVAANRKGDNAFPWKPYYKEYEEFLLGRIKSWMRQSTIFYRLGNTSAAYSSIALATDYGVEILQKDTALLPPSLRKPKEECESSFDLLMGRRHPDPKDSEALQLEDPGLQVRGCWKRLQGHGAAKGKPKGRHTFISAVWEGTYYIWGGHHGLTERLHDGWALDLRDIDAGWRTVTPYSTKYGYEIVSSHLMVYKDKAYLFQGGLKLPTFDFRTETWGQVTTTAPAGYLNFILFFQSDDLRDYTAQVLEGKMYVFGGQWDENRIGTNQLAALDLKTLEWEILGGSPHLNTFPGMPGCRTAATSWVAEGKMYVALGDACRTAARVNEGTPGAGTYDWEYEDLWSFDVKTKSWTQEKWTGSTPSRRSEAGYAFNSKWNRAIVFGGWTTNLAFREPDSWGLLTFAYLADTFIWSPETRRWQNVITRNFPTWRSKADLFVDQTAGRTFLFGGFVSPKVVPGRTKSNVLAFGDLWELCLDIPNGHFDEAEFEPDRRFVMLGPWRRCFTCDKVGDWLVCSGSCRGTKESAAFCRDGCQKKGWAGHKQLNGCRKLETEPLS